MNPEDLDFGLHLTSSADRDLKSLDKPIRDEVLEEIHSLPEEPSRGELKKGNLSKIWVFEPTISRRESYRIAYTRFWMDDEPWISVVQIGTRENFYEDLKRRADRLDIEDFI
jgi:mRNA-degrading endonuclease RelE of RelBE toxin-antitoxin system